MSILNEELSLPPETLKTLWVNPGPASVAPKQATAPVRPDLQTSLEPTLKTLNPETDDGASVELSHTHNSIIFDDGDGANPPQCFLPFISSSVLLDCSLLVKSHHDLRKALEEFNAKGMPKARDMEESIAKKHVRRNPMNTLLQINVCSSSGDEGKEKVSTFEFDISVRHFS